MNVCCDKLITSAYSIPTSLTTNSYHMPAENASLTITTQYIHPYVDTCMLNAFHVPTLRAHLYEHKQWYDTTFKFIDWNLTERYMTTLNNTHHTNVVKFFYN